MITIVGPNTGSHLGTGGGVRVALNMAEALLEEGFEVRVVAIDGFDTKKLDDLHGTNLQKYESDGSLRLHYLLRESRKIHLTFPLKVALISLFLNRLLSKADVELLVFHDDVPKPILQRRWPVKTVLYSHFPYMARIVFNVCDPVEAEDRLRMTKEHIMRILMRPTIYTNKRPDALLIANSSVTKKFMEGAWGKPIGVIYPPVALPRIEHTLDQKEDLVVAIGTIQPNKRFGEILTGFSMTRAGRLCIVGRPSSSWYLEWVKSRIQELHLGGRVELMMNVGDEEKAALLQKAKIIVSASRFEPFGISVLEGMHAGCVPVVRQSELSGPWVDICERGRYGYGFEDEKGLADAIEYILGSLSFAEMSVRSKQRSATFSYESFKRRWLSLVKQCCL